MQELQRVVKLLQEISDTTGESPTAESIVIAGGRICVALNINSNISTSEYVDIYPDLDWVESMACHIEIGDFTDETQLRADWAEMRIRIKALSKEILTE